jgi:hypothetical protein
MSQPKKHSHIYFKHTLSFIQFKNGKTSLGLISWIDQPEKGKYTYIRYFDLITGLEMTLGRSNLKEFATVRRWPARVFNQIYKKCEEQNLRGTQFPKLLDSLGYGNDFIKDLMNELDIAESKLEIFPTSEPKQIEHEPRQFEFKSEDSEDPADFLKKLDELDEID